MRARSAVPERGITSGELFYRAAWIPKTRAVADSNDDDIRWPRRGIGTGLHKFLAEGCDESEIIARAEASRRELVSVRKYKVINHVEKYCSLD